MYRPDDRPANRNAFRVAPWAIVEVLSDDADHDLVRKDGVYADLGVVHRAYIEPWGRYPWWCRLDGADQEGPVATWTLEGWPALMLHREQFLAD